MKPLLAALIAALIAVVGTSGLALAQAQARGGCDMPCGTFLTKWGCGGCGDGEFDVFEGPHGVAVDGSGNVFVADPHNAGGQPRGPQARVGCTGLLGSNLHGCVEVYLSRRSSRSDRPLPWTWWPHAVLPHPAQM